ncbi:serine protease [Thermogutta sp.]|uniref:S1 family peptidase n=1 Tax=Thermogutta sp. TaxID=1962930 RepID=UPI0032208DD2
MKAQRATAYLLIAILTFAGWGRSALGWFWNTGTPATPHPAVARVIALDTRGASLGTGTLVAVNEYHGLVVTNWHVVRDARGSILVQFPDGFASPATVLKVDRDWDLAALAIWRPRAKPVPIAVDPPRPGDVLMIAGYGQGDYRVSYGPCTQYLSPSPGLPAELVELRATARQGDSGGPIFNARGELAGVLFGSGFTETMGAYCGRVRSFLFPLKETFDKLPPPDSLLLAANALGPPGRTPAGGLAPLQGQSLIPAEPASSVGSPPVTLPLTASDNATARVPEATSSGTRTPGSSQASWSGSSPTQPSPANRNFGSSRTDQGARGYAASDVSAWRPAETVADPQDKGKLAAGAYSSSAVPNDAASFGFGSGAAGASSVSGYSIGKSGAPQTYSGLSDGYASSQTGKDIRSDSADYDGLNASRDSVAMESGARGKYERGSTNHRAGNIQDFYAKSDDSGARAPGKFDTTSDTTTQTVGSQRGGETGRRPYEAWDYWSSKPYESAEDPYAERKSLATWTADSEKTSSSTRNNYGQESREDRRQHGTATASINTQSGGAGFSRKSEDAATGKGAWSSHPLNQGNDGEKESPAGDLSHTIETREETGQYGTSESSWGYKPIPVYDAEPTFVATRSPSDSSHLDSSDRARSGRPGLSRSETHSETHLSQSSASLGSPGEEYNDRKETGTSREQRWSGSGESGYRNAEDHREEQSDFSSSGSKRNDMHSVGETDTTGGDSQSGLKTSDDTSQSRRLGDGYWPTAPTGERRSPSGGKGNEKVKNSKTYEQTSTKEFSDGDLATSSRTTTSGGTSLDSKSAENVGPVDNTAAKGGQPSAAGNKINVGWETMIGVFGLLVLFVQSMRWLSLLYDRSYYRRRTYRTTRRRTTWPPPPPAGYRWYY